MLLDSLCGGGDEVYCSCFSAAENGSRHGKVEAASGVCCTHFRTLDKAICYTMLYTLEQHSVCIINNMILRVQYVVC